MAGSSTTYQNNLLHKFLDKDFIDSLLKGVDEIFNNMNVIDRFLFSGYDTFIEDVQNFKTSLLKFVLESKIHLTILKDNFEKPRYQQASDQVKLDFIKERLEKINRATLFDYITACQKLIDTSLALHKKYNQQIFKLQYIALNTLGFAAIGAAVGYTIGLAIPFLSAIEAGFGAVVGVIGGLAFAIYRLKEKMKEIDVVRQQLITINEALKQAKQQLSETYNKLGKAQEELKEQQNGKSFQDVKDLESYVVITHDEFIKLEKVLINMKVDEQN